MRYNPRERGARRVESQSSIDLADLNKRKLIRVGNSFKLTWNINGEVTKTARVSVVEEGLVFSYRVKDEATQDWRLNNQTILFGYTPTAFGGQRRWFTCPKCSRNRRVIFLNRQLLCRECLRLTYESQYERDFNRGFERAGKIRKKLGGDPHWDAFFPEKSKHMKSSKYNQMRARHNKIAGEFTPTYSEWLDQ